MVRSMKKLMALVCLIASTALLGACGSQTELSEYEQNKLDKAQAAAGQYIQMLDELSREETLSRIQEFTGEELAYIIEQQNGQRVDGDAFQAAAASFRDAKKSIGSITGLGEMQAEADEDRIVVLVQIAGEKKEAEAEIIVSNDLFVKFESGALNPVASLNDMMMKAVLNTVIGMGTVFAVLILIICIISAMAWIPKLQKMLENKKKAKADAGKAVTENASIDKAVAHIEERENAEGAEADDSELVAVIAAAIAASEGAASPDEFVVRSIRRRKGNR